VVFDDEHLALLLHLFRSRLGPDAKQAVMHEASTARLVKEAEKMKTLADARLAQCSKFWAESPAPRSAGNRNRLREDVEDMRARARAAVQKEQSAEVLRKEMEDMRELQGEKERTHQAKIKGLMREVETLKQRCAEAEVNAEEHEESKMELKETIGLLQQKVLTANEREIEHQRKLRVFTRLEPIFSSLAESFNFESPDEVVNRLEFLENQSLHSIDQLIKFQEENAELKKKVETLQQEATAARVALQTEGNRRQRETDLATAEHAEELQSMTTVMQKIQEKDEKNFRLQSAVVDLWTRCTASSELVKATDAVEGYFLHEPLEMVCALQEILLMHAPTVAGKKHHELQAYANKVWREQFESNTELKNKTLDIFMVLHELAKTSLRTIEDLGKQIAELKKQIKKAKESEDRAMRKMKRTEVHHQKFLDDRRVSSGTSKIREDVNSNNIGVEEGKPSVHGTAQGILPKGVNRPFSAAAAFGRSTPQVPDHAPKSRPFSATAFAPQTKMEVRKPPRDVTDYASATNQESSGKDASVANINVSIRPRPFSALAQVANPNCSQNDSSNISGRTTMPKLKRPQSAFTR